jgi:hypothetical protein
MDTMSGQLPVFLEELLRMPPRAGEGVHGWLFRVARQLHAHMSALEIVSLLESRVEGCGRAVPRSEIVSAVQNSISCAWQPCGRDGGGSSIVSAPKWPALNQEQREALIRDGGGLVDLWELSDPRLDDSQTHTEEIIDRLFPGDPLLCCGLSKSKFETRSRTEWRGGVDGLQLIVPSPMTARSGLTKEGKESAHALSITGPRRFLVIEFDSGDPDEHATLLIHLAGFAALVCVLHSGGKSLHGWFFVEGQPEEKVLRFFRYAVSLSADERLWGPSQFVRMPDGPRDNGKRQSVFFLSFEPLETIR